MAYTRKTRDEWEVQMYTSQGWETVNTLSTYRDARTSLKEYQGSFTPYAYRLKKKRVKNG